jgi:hypothetical protein
VDVIQEHILVILACLSASEMFLSTLSSPKGVLELTVIFILAHFYLIHLLLAYHLCRLDVAAYCLDISSVCLLIFAAC